ncbi:MAG TPA: hypothetical protein VGK22_23190 [Candidatus Angelobacter sp.]|jgi:hypothetical protein
MPHLFVTLCFAAAVVISAGAEDLHMHEPGSAVVLSHSAFAHGYRHGYEEGYHIGNTDISVGTQPRAKLKNIRGMKLGYSSQFGSRAVFEKGFQAGLRAGYYDGYSGYAFRAVDSLRSLSASLEEPHTPGDGTFANFDLGFFSGYNDGFEHGGSVQPSAAQVDFHFVSCSNFHPASLHSAKQSDQPTDKSYCEGYRRGFALGHADGSILGPDNSRLEASK